jgi:HPt (histidine-containing phosphotransfer) domain-containing protein
VEELVGALSRTKPRGRAGDGVIDAAAFENLRVTMGADFIGELIDTFNEDTPKLLAELRRALEAGDVEAFRRTAHSLKSNSANFGATLLSAQAKELEMQAKAGRLGGADEKISQLQAEYERVRRALEEKRNPQ